MNNLEIDIHAKQDYAFRAACKRGHLDVVKFLLSFSTNSFPNDASFEVEENDSSFRNSLVEENDESFKVEKNNRKININAREDYAFRYACGNGHFPVVKFLLEYAEKNNLEIDIHAQRDFAFLYCKREEIINLLLPLLNRNKDEFYFYKEKEYYILKPLDFEMNRTSTKFEHFQVYHRRSTYLNDCIDAYQVYLRRFRKKSAFSMIIDH